MTLTGPYAEAIDRLMDGDAGGAARIARKQLAAARASKDEVSELAALMNLCALEGPAGKYAQVRAYADRALKILGPTGQPRLRAMVLYHRGSACLLQKALAEASASFGEGANVAEAAGLTGLAGQSAALQGRALQLQGDGKGAIFCLVRAASLLAQRGAPGGASILQWLAELKQSIGETAYYEALTDFERANDYPALRDAHAKARGRRKRELAGMLAAERRALEEE